MAESFLFALTLVSALGCGLVAGVFFAFSSFVMKALARLPASQGIAAMQSINIVVINPWFMTLLFGSGLTCLVLAGWTLFARSNPASVWILVGALSYVVGTVGVTLAFNVPRNNVLAGLDPESVEAEGIWGDYVRGWTAWNHVRTAAALVAAGALTIALR